MSMEKKKKKADALFPLFVGMRHKESAERQNIWSLLLERKSVLNLKKS